MKPSAPRLIRPFFFLLIPLILFGCGSQPPTAAPPTPTFTPAIELTPTSEPTSTPDLGEPTPTAIASLIDIEQAVVRVEARGKFFAPKLGSDQVGASC